MRSLDEIIDAHVGDAWSERHAPRGRVATAAPGTLRREGDSTIVRIGGREFLATGIPDSPPPPPPPASLESCPIPPASGAVGAPPDLPDYPLPF